MRARIRPEDVSAAARVLAAGTEHSKPTPKSRPKAFRLPLGTISSDLDLNAHLSRLDRNDGCVILGNSSFEDEETGKKGALARFVGNDFHPSWQQVSWPDTETRETAEQAVAHGPGEVEKFHRRFAAPALRKKNHGRSLGRIDGRWNDRFHREVIHREISRVFALGSLAFTRC
jgi:hypothetical protein